MLVMTNADKNGRGYLVHVGDDEHHNEVCNDDTDRLVEVTLFMLALMKATMRLAMVTLTRMVKVTLFMLAMMSTTIRFAMMRLTG